MEYRKVVTTPYRRFVVLLIVSTLPTGILGLLLESVVESVANNLLIVGLNLLGTGGILFVSDLIESGKKKQKDINYGDAFTVGFAQGIATLPGVSRSGTTITCCLLCGFDRKYAVKYSFIMSMPVIFCAMIMELFKIGESGIGVSAGGCILGMLFATVIGYVALKIMDKLVVSKYFKYFSFYCFLMGAVSIIVFLVKL